MLFFSIPYSPAINYVQTMKQADSIYLDHAAGTFLLPEVRATLFTWLNEQTANPSSIHAEGRLAGAALDSARQMIAESIQSKPSEIIFTSGGTEANNMAVIGGAYSLQNQGKHIITCNTEHPSILESMKHLEKDGYRVTYLSTDSQGQIDLNELEASIADDTTLISLMWVNNETGLLHPISEIAGIAKERGVRFHCDSVQALGHFPIRVDELSVDSLSFSGHKIGAPAGIGVLYLRKGRSLAQLNHGGSQESNFRGGTQNHMGAQAFAQALRYHQDNLDPFTKHFKNLSDQLLRRLEPLPGIQINRQGKNYTPNIVNCSFHRIDGEALFIRLDMKNMAVSNGSACSSGSQAPSHVLTALGMKKSLAQASLRISSGIQTTKQEIDRFCDELEQIILSIQRDID